MWLAVLFACSVGSSSPTSQEEPDKPSQEVDAEALSAPPEAVNHPVKEAPAPAQVNAEEPVVSPPEEAPIEEEKAPEIEVEQPNNEVEGVEDVATSAVDDVLEDEVTEEESAEEHDATPPEVEPEPAAVTKTYSLGPAGSFLAVVVYNDPESLMSGMGHDHTLVAKRFSGSFTWNEDDPSQCQVNINLSVIGLDVDPPGARARVGIDPGGSVSESNEKKILKNAQTKKQLNMTTFPTIKYVSSSCTTRSDGRYDVTGKLTIRGKGKTLKVPMKIVTDESGVRASGVFSANATDFGFSAFSNLGGALKNKNRMQFHVDLVGK